MSPPAQREITNFGGNLTLRPQAAFTPASEDEVLRILQEQRGKRIRAIGRLHSWSEAPTSDEVLLDLRKLNAVHVWHDERGPGATIGAGCQIKDALRELDHHGLTLPTVGLISEQTIAGAAATGTHGSGRSSLSHYVSAVRLAGYHPTTGAPVIREVQGDVSELRAARCSLGCLGIALAIEIRPRPQYRVEEWFRLHATLDDVLAAEASAPLQQFYLVPWLWKFMGQHRRETDQPRSWLAPLYRLYWLITIDVGLHVCLLFLVRLVRSRRAIQAFFRWAISLTVIRNWHVVDKSQNMLIMEHELFRHIEVELFVKQSNLATALDFVKAALLYFDGDREAFPPATAARLSELGLAAGRADDCGSYTHHYPICIRRVFPDDTLLSMTSDCDEPSYALSFISYEHPTRRAAFLRLAQFLTASLVTLFAARPHWGKLCSLAPAQVAQVYPRAGDFRDVCRRLDPSGRFLNRWTERILFENQTP